MKYTTKDIAIILQDAESATQRTVQMCRELDIICLQLEDALENIRKGNQWFEEQFKNIDSELHSKIRNDQADLARKVLDGDYIPGYDDGEGEKEVKE